MTLTAATVSPAAPAPVESEVSLARLYVLRAMYLLLVIGGAIVFLPQLIGHEPTARGVIPSMLGGVWVLACFGASLPAADASAASLRAGVEDNLADRLRATATDGGLEHGGIHRGFHGDCVGPPASHPDYPMGICLPALSEEAGGTLALGTEPRTGHPSPGDCFGAFQFQQHFFAFDSPAVSSMSPSLRTTR